MGQTLDGILQFQTGAIDANAIAADAIGASEIAADAIGASELADAAIDAATFAVDVGQWRHAIGNYNFGDDTGGIAAYTILTVTGDVLLVVFGLCQTAVEGAGTIELGIAGNTASLIAQATALDLIQYEVWEDATPTVSNPAVVDAFGGARQFVVANGANVIFTIAGAVTTAGDIDFHAFWMPLSADGAAVAA